MSYRRINQEERHYIHYCLSLDKTRTSIAADLGRSVSSVSREINGHLDASGYYCPVSAQRQADQHARISHRRDYKLAGNVVLIRQVIAKLKHQWSPRQISKWLKQQYSQNESMQVSAETIYQYIYVQTKGSLKKELISYLRQRKKNRKPAKGRSEKRGKITDMISIHQRPKEVADRSVPGHWEGDLIIGKDHKSAIGTLVERQTRFAIIVRLKGSDAESVRKAFARKMRYFPSQLKGSLTYDQGKEMAQHKQFTMDTKMKVYFCDPASPWQRGMNENTNMLIRGFFPKGTDFNEVSSYKLKWVQNSINERPRETLKWSTPMMKMEELLLKYS